MTVQRQDSFSDTYGVRKSKTRHVTNLFRGITAIAMAGGKNKVGRKVSKDEVHSVSPRSSNSSNNDAAEEDLVPGADEIARKITL